MRRALLFVSMAITMTFVPTSARSDEQQHEAFKRQMRPIAGKRVTLAGTLAIPGKLGPAIRTDDGGWVYLLRTGKTEGDWPSPLVTFTNRDRIQVTGKLGYQEAGWSPNERDATMPEHFYIDLADASIVPVPAKRIVKEY